MNAPNFHDAQRESQGWYPFSRSSLFLSTTLEGTLGTYPTSLGGGALTPGGWATLHASSRLRAISGSFTFEAKGASTDDVRVSLSYAAAEKYHRQRLVSDFFPAILARGEDTIGTAEYDFGGTTYNYTLLSEATNSVITVPFLGADFAPHSFTLALIARRVGSLGPVNIPVDLRSLTVVFRAGVFFLLTGAGSTLYEPTGQLQVTMFQPGIGNRVFVCDGVDLIP